MTKNKKIWSWAFYDWANSAFSTTVVAGFFPIFFGAYWADPNNVNQSTLQLGIANSIASIIIALISPIIGAIADCASARKKFLITFAFLGYRERLTANNTYKGKHFYFGFSTFYQGW